jgi:hypothetical protein
LKIENNLQHVCRYCLISDFMHLHSILSVSTCINYYIKMIDICKLTNHLQCSPCKSHHTVSHWQCERSCVNASIVCSFFFWISYSKEYSVRKNINIWKVDVLFVVRLWLYFFKGSHPAITLLISYKGFNVYLAFCWHTWGWMM